MSSAPFGIFVNDAPDPLKVVAVITPETFALPFTSSFAVGVAELIPTSPESLIIKRSPLAPLLLSKILK